MPSSLLDPENTGFPAGVRAARAGSIGAELSGRSLPGRQLCPQTSSLDDRSPVSAPLLRAGSECSQWLRDTMLTLSFQGFWFCFQNVNRSVYVLIKRAGEHRLRSASTVQSSAGPRTSSAHAERGVVGPGWACSVLLGHFLPLWGLRFSSIP